jgi:hypothetical protein
VGVYLAILAAFARPMSEDADPVHASGRGGFWFAGMFIAVALFGLVGTTAVEPSQDARRVGILALGAVLALGAATGAAALRLRRERTSVTTKLTDLSFRRRASLIGASVVVGGFGVLALRLFGPSSLFR